MRNLIIGIALVVIVMLGGIWLFDMGNTVSVPGVSPSPTSQSQALQQLDEITDNPDKFIGKQVAVQGEVGRVLGRNTIVLDVPGDVLNDEILVVSRSPIGASVADAQGLFSNKQVILRGVVDRFVFTTYRDTLESNLQPNAVAAYEGRPFILTDTVNLVEDNQ